MEDVDVNKKTHRALLVIILFPSDSLLTLYPITFTPNFLKLWSMMWNLCLLKSEKCRHFRLVIRSILNFSKCDFVQRLSIFCNCEFVNILTKIKLHFVESRINSIFFKISFFSKIKILYAHCRDYKNVIQYWHRFKNGRICIA